MQTKTSPAPTSKQINYLDMLGRQLGEGGAWDMFPGMSRSKAQRKATASDASEAIEAAKQRLALKEQRADLSVGDCDKEGHLCLPKEGGGVVWIELSTEHLALWEQHRGTLDWVALQARRLELRDASEARKTAAIRAEDEADLELRRAMNARHQGQYADPPATPEEMARLEAEVQALVPARDETRRLADEARHAHSQGGFLLAAMREQVAALAAADVAIAEQAQPLSREERALLEALRSLSPARRGVVVAALTGAV